MTGALFLGTSGFAYPEWKGIFYPEELKDEAMLHFYASRFRSVEINYTFRRTPEERTLRTWAERTPQEFRFTLKAHQRITHTLRLRSGRAGASAFVELARILGERLGTILFQCPPTLQYERDLLESFLDSLPAGTRYAMEFRHPSWGDAMTILEERGVAWCVAETDEAPVRPPAVPRRPFGYLRLRKETYEDHELAAWGTAIRRALDENADVYCYLKHEEKATGARYAERLGELLAGVPETAS